MALIKHAAAATLPRDAIVLNLAELSEEAARITRRAEERAAQIVTAAQAERRRLIDTATEEGFAAGERAGKELGYIEGGERGLDDARAEHGARLEEVGARWTKALDAFEALRESMLMQAKTDALALALRLAERITKRVVAADPKVASAQMAAALELIGRPTRLTVRTHPDDLEETTREAKTLATRLAAARHLEVIPDPALTRGSIIVSSDRGVIDATIETQLERVCEALLPGRGAALVSATIATQPPSSEPSSPSATMTPATPVTPVSAAGEVSATPPDAPASIVDSESDAAPDDAASAERDGDEAPA